MTLHLARFAFERAEGLEIRGRLALERQLAEAARKRKDAQKREKSLKKALESYEMDKAATIRDSAADQRRAKAHIDRWLSKALERCAEAAGPNLPGRNRHLRQEEQAKLELAQLDAALGQWRDSPPVADARARLEALLPETPDF